jgi:hypothetical protein
VGTNSDQTAHPTWPLDARVQNFIWKGPRAGTFAPAQYPVFNEANVGFSLSYAHLLLATLPASEGVVLVNTGVGGTGFHKSEWNATTGPLALQSVKAVADLAAALPAQLGGNYSLTAMLWHQGEQDGGDNGDGYSASYCDYLQGDLSPLIDFFRAQFPGASPATPFIDGGLLPYWVDKEAPKTTGVMEALYALNTSRACTATADSRVFPLCKPGLLFGLPVLQRVPCRAAGHCGCPISPHGGMQRARAAPRGALRVRWAHKKAPHFFLRAPLTSQRPCAASGARVQ